VAKAYALLRTIMGTAVADGPIRRNPCQIKNGGTVSTPERPTATILEAFAVADAGQSPGIACSSSWGPSAGFVGVSWWGCAVRM
jgi:hypothetical protein